MPWKTIIPIWALIVIGVAVGFALEWRWDRTHFTCQDDERLEPPR